MAAYIDLNPVRAKMVEDPLDYPYSGYAEAVAGHSPGTEAYNRSHGAEQNWRMVLRADRMLLYGAGEAKGVPSDGSPTRAGFTREEVVKVWGDEE